MSMLRNSPQRPALTGVASESPIPPARVLADWRLVEHEALAVPLALIEKLAPDQLADITDWARAVARSRKARDTEIPPRPPVLDRLLAAPQHSPNHDAVFLDDSEFENHK